VKQVAIWYAIVTDAAVTWNTFQDIRRLWAHASLVGDDVVVFNLCGNRFRLVVTVGWGHAVFFQWFGSHAEYDDLDVMRFSYAARRDPHR
jgi:mRNA interferase HigB